MKKKMFCLLASICLVAAGAASGDSLSVTSAAALGGVAQNNCTGDGMPGPCGLEVFHDNTSAAFVEDRSPQNETVYRASFLFHPNNISPGTKLRQNIFRLIGPNPNPGNFSCSTASLVSVSRVFLKIFRPDGSGYSVFITGLGNRCGERGTSRVDIPGDQPSRICIEIEHGNSLTGRIAIAATDPANPCPTSGGAAWQTNAVSNGNTNVDRARMGTIGTNNFNAGEVGSLFFDEFESFRTLAP